ncbi:MAG: protease SohB [Plesiomonas sp.]
MEFLYQYGVFLAKAVTVFAVIGGLLVLVFGLAQRNKPNKRGELQITDLGQQHRELVDELKELRLDEHALKIARKKQKKADKIKEKERKKAEKIAEKEAEKATKTADASITPENTDESAGKQLNSTPEHAKPCVYVLNFKGSMDAHEVASLREEVTAVLAIATEKDEVLLRLESPGGVVHGYGLASSQLARIKAKGIKLTVTVDKVAASGGYMMACVADHIVSAPFAIIGSIGVVAQIPNIHRLLKKNDIDIELMTAGEYKRTLTMLGENTDKGREKFRQDLEDTHQLFKNFVAQHRPSLNIDHVATGEHWFGEQALALGLVDEIAASDDILLREMAEKDVLEVRYILRKKLTDKLAHSAEKGVDRLLMRWIQRSQRPLL